MKDFKHFFRILKPLPETPLGSPHRTSIRFGLLAFGAERNARLDPKVHSKTGKKAMRRA